MPSDSGVIVLEQEEGSWTSRERRSRHGRRGERQARSGPTSAGMEMRELKTDEDADGGVARRSRRNERKEMQLLFADVTRGRQQQGHELAPLVEAAAAGAVRASITIDE